MKVSCILPLVSNAPLEELKACLKALAKQKEKDFELIIVASSGLAEKIQGLVARYGFARILTASLGKSQARNLGAQKAKAEYLYHLDVDMAPSPKVISQCLTKASQGAQAVTIPPQEKPRPQLINRCRALERRLLQNSPFVTAPLFIKKSLFEKLGGYEPALDPADDWHLYLSLKGLGVKPVRIEAPVLTSEPSSLKQALFKKYRLGQAWPFLKQKNPQAPYLKPGPRLSDYFRNRREIIKEPLLALNLAGLKLLDISAFLLGALLAPKPKNPYQFEPTAKSYDQKRLGYYKDLVETKALFQLLPAKKAKVLEVGCGTGRFTKRLTAKGWPVVPIDNSQAMLDKYRSKKGLPKAQLASATKLPFSDRSFPIIVSIRVIWHLDKKRVRKMFKEICRVAQKTVILDVTNQKRWPKIYQRLHPNVYFFNQKELNQLSRKHGFEIKSKLPLDNLTPFWLDWLPIKLRKLVFPPVYQLDRQLSRFIPPGRYLLKLERGQ